jgi:hypothetical protein
MINDKLAQHLSNELWLQKSKVMEVLERYSEEEPTIHAEKPSDIEKRVKALELAIFGSKKFLSIDTQADWKKVECLSFEDVKYFIEGYHTTVEKIIKNKLKK